MKKILLIFVCISFAYYLHSQIIIERSDYFDVNDSIPRIYYSFENDMDAIPVDSVWPLDMTFGDFDSLFSLNLIDTLIFFPTEETFFSDASFWFLTRDGLKMYLKITDDKVLLVGAQMQMPFLEDEINFNFVDTLIWANFPLEFESHNLDEGTGMDNRHISEFQSVIPVNYYSTLSAIYDTVRFLMNIKFNCNYDEFGNITFNGKYNLNGNYNYLRENRFMKTLSDVQLRNQFSGNYTSISDIPSIGDLLPIEFPIVDTSITHLYWTKGMNYPILEVEYTSDLDSIFNMSFRYAYLSDIEEFEYNFVKIFPNPSTDLINFCFQNPGNYTFFAYNLQGQIVNKKDLYNSNSFSLNVKDLPSGIYFYKLIDNNNLKSFAGKFIKK